VECEDAANHQLSTVEPHRWQGVEGGSEALAVEEGGKVLQTCWGCMSVKKARTRMGMGMEDAWDE
jgi:hypothetical protein